MINAYAKANNLIKDKDLNLSGDDAREGLTAVISVKVPEPRFEGQTKTKLSNGEVDGIVQKITGEELKYYFETNPQVARKLIDKCLNAARAREAARKARETVRKGALSAVAFPENWPTAPHATQLYLNFTSLRVTLPGVLPNKAETAQPKPSCQSAVNCSTWKRPASIRYWQIMKSAH